MSLTHTYWTCSTTHSAVRKQAENKPAAEAAAAKQAEQENWSAAIEFYLEDAKGTVLQTGFVSNSPLILNFFDEEEEKYKGGQNSW